MYIMAMKIPLSFKESEKEMYDFLQSQLSPSIYIKQLLLKEMKETPEHKEKPLKASSTNLLDF